MTNLRRKRTSKTFKQDSNYHAREKTKYFSAKRKKNPSQMEESLNHSSQESTTIGPLGLQDQTQGENLWEDVEIDNRVNKRKEAYRSRTNQDLEWWDTNRQAITMSLIKKRFLLEGICSNCNKEMVHNCIVID